MSYLDGNGLSILWTKIKSYVDNVVVSGIPDLGVVTSKLANLAVTTDKIANNAVNMDKLGTDVVNTLNGLKATTGYVPSNGGSATITFPASSIHFVLCCARTEYVNSYCGIYFIACTSNSTIGIDDIKASNMSYTKSGNRVVFTNNNAAYELLYIITLNGGVPTIS